MHQHRLERVLVVNDDFELQGLITVKDILKSTEHPNACKDELRPAARRRGGRRRRRHRGARRGAGRGRRRRASWSIPRTAMRRACSTACTGSRRRIPTVQVIGGNIATADGAQALVDHGADGVKVGIGPGSICTTRIVAGVGVPQITRDPERARGARRHGRAAASPTAASAIRATSPRRSPPGASSVMLGSLFAGTEESPGEIELFQGRSYKSYRGMGSLGAMQKGSADRYFQDAEARATPTSWCPKASRAAFPTRAPLSAVIDQLMGGVRAAWATPAARRSTRCARDARVRRDHLRRHARVARARRADHQGSAELPRRVTPARRPIHRPGSRAAAWPIQPCTQDPHPRFRLAGTRS